MAQQVLTFQIPVQLAVAAGAVLPDPGGASAAGVIIWSTTTSSHLKWNGTAWTAVDTTGAAGAVSISSVSVTVPYPSFEYTAVVADAAVLANSKIMLSYAHSLDTDQNTAQDIDYSVAAVAAGSFSIRIIPAVNPQAIGGIFKFFYLIG